MEDLVAVEIVTGSGGPFFVMTFGRVQDSVDPTELESIVLERAPAFSGIEVPTSARVCWSLRYARDAPYFYEALADLSLELAAMRAADDYGAWRRRIDSEMREGRHLWYLGDPATAP